MATILVIDDDVHMRRILARMLSREHRVIEAEDGSVGVARFNEYTPDLVITDILMPKKEGIETIRELRCLSPAVRILAISGGGHIHKTDYLDMAGKLGADITLTKPVMAAELRAAVETLLSLSQAGSCTS